MEPWRAVDARNELVVSDSRHFEEDPDPRITIHIEVKRWIRTRIRIKGLRIRTLMYTLLYYG
jgi:hypothetical protein